MSPDDRKQRVKEAGLRWRGKNREKLRAKARVQNSLLTAEDRAARAGYYREYRKKTKDRQGFYVLKSRLKFQYGLTLEQYEDMLFRQGGRCASCRHTNKGRRLCVDHNHTTGSIRALLCDDCNVALGWLHDDPVRCLLLAQYASDWK